MRRSRSRRLGRRALQVDELTPVGRCCKPAIEFFGRRVYQLRSPSPALASPFFLFTGSWAHVCSSSTSTPTSQLHPPALSHQQPAHPVLLTPGIAYFSSRPQPRRVRCLIIQSFFRLNVQLSTLITRLPTLNRVILLWLFLSLACLVLSD
ncbi:hypothetical protein GALMADRAFT_1140536 [Galerina marginata CBS 339.88]|uniref:Uncharacterized protein n=1 Tax=Galerina marginata (strain CBS 339.88) TaxID=685588 RepID=A0A067SGA1_GALM3|nr:hypothetical protein GALMADRAFT_1140536 [Galerina marginata CBS 339.88]